MRLKKILSLLVAMTMLFSCVGITAMAEESVIVSSVAELKVALANGGTVKLGADITVNFGDAGVEEGGYLYLETGEDTVLDLNGFTLTHYYINTNEEKTSTCILIGGDMRIKDGSTGQTGKLEAKETAYISAESIYTDNGWSEAPVITIESGNVIGLALGEGAAIDIKGGNVELAFYEQDYFYGDTEDEIYAEYSAYINSLVFLSDPAEYIPSDFYVIKKSDGTWGLSLEEPETTTAAAEVNGVSYETLDDAIAAAKAMTDGNVKVLKDASFTSTAISNNLVLDLNGCTITPADSNWFAFEVSTNGSLTITDSSEEKDGFLNGASTSNTIYMSGENSVFTLNGGRIYSNNNGIYPGTSTSKIYLNGGSIDSNLNTDDSRVVYSVYGELTVTGGTYTACHFALDYQATISVTGGTFNDSKVSKYCPDGYEAVNNGDGTYTVKEEVVVNPVAKIGDKVYSSVAKALKAAQSAGMGNVTITLIGGSNSADTTDSFNLAHWGDFYNVTFKQENPEKPFYLNSIYTGKRINEEGKFIFDGVNIVVTGQIWFESDAVLKNNSIVTRTSDTKNFILNESTVYIEPGSKYISQIDGLDGGNLVVDGGRTDGTYNTVNDYRTIYPTVNTSREMTLKNGAYVVVNAADENGLLDIHGKVNMQASRLDVLNEIRISSFAGKLILDTKSVVNTKKITGGGKIIIDTSNFAGEELTLISADMSEFTGTIELDDNPAVTYVKERNAIKLIKKKFIELTLKDGTVEYYSDMAEAVRDDQISYLEGVTIKLLDDYTGKGIRFLKPGMVLDLNGYTYTVNSGEGSNGSKTSCFQIKKDSGNTLSVIKNGTIKISPKNERGAEPNIYWVFNSYTGLNLENVTVDCTNLDTNSSNYILVNRVNTNITGTTSFINYADDTKNAIWNSESGTINIDTTGTIEGEFENSGSVVVKNGLFTSNVTEFCEEGYLAAKNADGLYKIAKLPNAEVTVLDPITLTAAEHNYMVLPSGDNSIDRPLEIVMNFKANDTLEEAIAGGLDKWLVDFNLKVTGLKNGKITADNCYLAGAYGSYGWIVIPADGMVLEDGVAYPVVATYDATLNYNDICKSVKDFTAAIHVDQAILDANPDFTIELSLVMTNPNDANDKFTVGEPAVYTAEDLQNKAPELPTATVKEIKNEDLTFALSFVADEAEEKQLAYYGNWYADFVLTINKDFTANADGSADGYLSGQYDGWSESWVNVPFVDTTLEAGTSLRILKYAIDGDLSEYSTPLTYKDVYDFVKDFNCGIFFDEEYLAANPDLVVTLELRIYSPDEYKKTSYVIGETYEFKASDIVAPVAAIGEEKYTSLEEAIAAAVEGDKITLLSNIALTEGVTVPADKKITLDLAGYAITGAPAEAKAFAVITNKGDLTITGEGAIVCDHQLTGSTSYAVNTIVNSGKLTVENGVIENKSTASNQIGYAIDNNSTAGNAVITVNGGEIKASGSNYYDGIRQFANSTTLENSVTVAGGSVSSIWMQNPSDSSSDRNTKDAKGSISVTGGTVAAIYLEPSNAFTASVTGGEIGKISAYETAEGRDLAGFVSGGKFTNKPDDAYAKEGFEFTENTEGEYEVTEKATLFEIGVTSVTLGNSLTANFYIDAENIVGENYYAIVKHYAEDKTIEEIFYFADWETRETNGVVTSYVIPYKNLAAKQMTDKLEVTVYYANGDPASFTKTDSLRGYALRGINTYKGKSDLTKAQKNVLIALVDMLNYGAAAQIEFEYREEELANADTDDFQEYATTDVSHAQNIQEKDENHSATTLVLNNNIVLTGYFKGVTENMYAVYSFTDHYGKTKSKRIEYKDFVVNRIYGHGVDVDELVIADAAQPVTITIYNENGLPYSTLVESMNSYLRRAINVKGEDTIYGKTAKFTKAAYNTLH